VRERDCRGPVTLLIQIDDFGVDAQLVESEDVLNTVTKDALKNEFHELALLDIVLPPHDGAAQDARHEPVDLFEVADDLLLTQPVIHVLS